jgi:hypothetical protein
MMDKCGWGYDLPRAESYVVQAHLLMRLAWTDAGDLFRASAFGVVAIVFLAPAAAGALLAAMPSNGLAGDPSANRHLDCEASAFQEYNAALLKLQGTELTPGRDPTIDEKHLQVPFSIERTIAGRRLEEGFCLRVVACERRAGGTDLEDAVSFIQMHRRRGRGARALPFAERN